MTGRIKAMDEPLEYFLGKTDLKEFGIKEFADGEKFFGLMLNDGRIGVCSTLGNRPDLSLLKGNAAADLSDPGQRIVINAWLNAVYNYKNIYEYHYDIFDRIDFRKYGSIVMIGYFESLHEKFRKSNTGLRVFDMMVENEFVKPLDGMDEALRSADAVIITGTAIFNLTFKHLIGNTADGCDVFLLGPSNILHSDMFRYRNIRMVFGSVFERYDSRVMELIARGHGARHFLNDINKVYLKSNDFVIR